jgi:Protein phosphatase 2C
VTITVSAIRHGLHAPPTARDGHRGGPGCGGGAGPGVSRFLTGRAVDNKGMSQQGDAHGSQEDDWWRQLYGEDADSDVPGAARGSDAGRGPTVDEHFHTALDAMSPPPPPRSETLRLRRPTAPPPPPSWPRPSRDVPPAPRDPEPPRDAAAGPVMPGVPAQAGEPDEGRRGRGAGDVRQGEARDEPSGRPGVLPESEGSATRPVPDQPHLERRGEAEPEQGRGEAHRPQAEAEPPGEQAPWDPWAAPPTFGPPPEPEPQAEQPEARPWDVWSSPPTFSDPIPAAERDEPPAAPPAPPAFPDPASATERDEPPAAPPPPPTAHEPPPAQPWAAWVTPRPRQTPPPPAAPTAPPPAESWTVPPPAGRPEDDEEPEGPAGAGPGQDLSFGAEGQEAPQPVRESASEPETEPEPAVDGRPSFGSALPSAPAPEPGRRPGAEGEPEGSAGAGTSAGPSSGAEWQEAPQPARESAGASEAEAESPVEGRPSFGSAAASVPEPSAAGEQRSDWWSGATAETGREPARRPEAEAGLRRPVDDGTSSDPLSGAEWQEAPQSARESAGVSEAEAESPVEGPTSFGSASAPEQPRADWWSGPGAERDSERVRRPEAEGEPEGPAGAGRIAEPSSGAEGQQAPPPAPESASEPEAEPELPVEGRPSFGSAFAPEQPRADWWSGPGSEPEPERGSGSGTSSDPSSGAEGQQAPPPAPAQESARVPEDEPEPAVEGQASFGSAPPQGAATDERPGSDWWSGPSAETGPEPARRPEAEWQPALQPAPEAGTETPGDGRTSLPEQPLYGGGLVPVPEAGPGQEPPQAVSRVTGFVEGEVRWAPELPPGWVPADESVRQGSGAPEVGEPEVVGGGPPTYGAEPTAWPEADPDALDGIVPDTVLDGAQYGRLTLRTVALRGDSARYRGQPRRDALLSARFGSGDDALLLVAMASGARGADEAHRAAQDTVRWIAGAVGRSRARLADDLRAARRGSLKSGLHRLTDRCYGRLRARGEDLGLADGAYTASLRCLLLPADPECRIRLFFGVGEGGLFRIRGGTWQDLDMGPDEASAPFRFRATVAQPGDALLMCSAGLAEPLRGEPELAAHLALRWGGGTVPGLAAYLSDAQTRVKGYADDRSAVTVWDA